MEELFEKTFQYAQPPLLISTNKYLPGVLILSIDSSLSGLIKSGMHSIRLQLWDINQKFRVSVPSYDGCEDYLHHIKETDTIMNDLYKRRQSGDT